MLHVDGRQRYEDVKEDFETYLPKVSDRSAVLFHCSPFGAGLDDGFRIPES